MDLHTVAVVGGRRLVTVSWRAPGRVNLIGEHTDYNDGFALPFAIEAGCTTTVTGLDEPILRLRSAQEKGVVEVALDGLAPSAVEGWASYSAGVLWALQRRDSASVSGGVDISVDGDVPLGAGLSSSAALSCSTAAALGDFFDLNLVQSDLVALARTSENDFVGAPTGGMDQLASVCSTADHVLLCDMQTLHTEQVPLDLSSADLRIVVIDTQAPHRHSDGEYGARRKHCEQAAALLGVASLRGVQDQDVDDVLRRLAAACVAAGDESEVDVLVRRVRHILTENARVLDVVALLRAGDVAAIGPILTASHLSMRDDFEITVDEVDTAVDAAISAGALGARMTGGGFGGCVIALTPPADTEDVADAVTAAFETNHLGEPRIFQVRPAQGVRKL